MEALEAPKRRPMPAYRDQEARKRAITEIVAVLASSKPELFDDVVQLTDLPPIDVRGLPEGAAKGKRGYEHDFVRNTWDHLARDVVASEVEIQAAFDEYQSLQPTYISWQAAS